MNCKISNAPVDDAIVVMMSNSTAEALLWYPMGDQSILSYCHEIDVWERYSYRMGEVESVGTVELVCVGRLLRMVCDPFLMSVCGSVGGEETLWEQNRLPWDHSAENQ